MLYLVGICDYVYLRVSMCVWVYIWECTTELCIGRWLLFLTVFVMYASMKMSVCVCVFCILCVQQQIGMNAWSDVSVVCSIFSLLCWCNEKIIIIINLVNFKIKSVWYGTKNKQHVLKLKRKTKLTNFPLKNRNVEYIWCCMTSIST